MFSENTNLRLSQFTFDILGQLYLTFLLFSLSTDPNSNSHLLPLLGYVV